MPNQPKPPVPVTPNVEQDQQPEPPPVVPVPVAAPVPEVQETPDLISEDALDAELLDVKIVAATPFRRRKALAIEFLADSPNEAPLTYYVVEYGLRTFSEVITAVKEILNLLISKGIIKGKENIEDIPTIVKINGVAEALLNNQDHIYKLLVKGVYTSEDYKSNITMEDLLELPAGMVVTLLSAIYQVNFEKGSLGKALKGLGRK